MNVVAEERTQAYTEHRGNEEQKQDVKFTALTYKEKHIIRNKRKLLKIKQFTIKTTFDFRKETWKIWLQQDKTHKLFQLWKDL